MHLLPKAILCVLLLFVSPGGIPLAYEWDLSDFQAESEKVNLKSPEPVCHSFSNEPPAIQTNIWREHGEAFDSLAGVYAYSNAFRGKYQCTELVHRFFRERYGIPTRIGMGIGHANRILAGIYQLFGSKNWHKAGSECAIRLKLYRNGIAEEAPEAGSAISFETGQYGHVAIVRYVENIDKNALRLYLFEQHGFPKHQPGEPKEIRSFEIRLNKQGRWEASATPGIGRPNYWLNVVGVE